MFFVFFFQKKKEVLCANGKFTMIANREKVMMSCARPQNMQLRKQKSVNCESVCQLTSATRERRLRLQKQYSVDQNANIRDVSTHRNQRSIDIQSKCGNGSWNGSDPAPGTSLRIFTAFKNKTNTAGIEPKTECVFKFGF